MKSHRLGDDRFESWQRKRTVSAQLTREIKDPFVSRIAQDRQGARGVE